MDAQESLCPIIQEFETKGFYKPSYFYIYLKGDFDEDLNKMSKEDIGTFIHEYIHYLQNITTVFGLLHSQFQYEVLFLKKINIVKREAITLPLHIPYAEKFERINEKFRIGYGSQEFYQDIDFNNINHIAKSKIIGHNRVPIHLIEVKINVVEKKEILFGAWHIKESMAHLYQSFFEDDLKKGYDVPYNLVKIIAEKYFPNIVWLIFFYIEENCSTNIRSEYRILYLFWIFRIPYLCELKNCFINRFQ